MKEYSFIEILQIIGGFLILILFLLIILLIWCDAVLIGKLILTDILLMIGIRILEKSESLEN